MAEKIATVRSQTLAMEIPAGLTYPSHSRGHRVFEPAFVSLKPRWEPLRLSNQLWKIESAVLNRPPSTKWDVEACHLEGRPASCRGWEVEWSEPRAR